MLVAMDVDFHCVVIVRDADYENKGDGDVDKGTFTFAFMLFWQLLGFSFRSVHDFVCVNLS